MNIRYATMADLDDIASVESVCFPVLEAATKLKPRLEPRSLIDWQILTP